MRVCRSRSRPVLASKYGFLSNPVSTTTDMPGTVSDDSAMGVDSTMRRDPATSRCEPEAYANRRDTVRRFVPLQ